MQTSRVHKIVSVIRRWNDEVAPKCIQILLGKVHVELSHHELSNGRVRSIGADEEVEADGSSARTRDRARGRRLLVLTRRGASRRLFLSHTCRILLGHLGFPLPGHCIKSSDFFLKVTRGQSLVEKELCRRLFHQCQHDMLGDFFSRQSVQTLFQSVLPTGSANKTCLTYLSLRAIHHGDFLQASVVVPHMEQSSVNGSRVGQDLFDEARHASSFDSPYASF
jgi:hypothetical protein